MSSSDDFLKSFIHNELFFMASRELQEKKWKDATGDQFSEAILLFSEAWSTIEKNRRHFTLSQTHYQMLEKLYKMVEFFQINHPFPSSRIEYEALLTKPDWLKIQEFALTVYNQLKK